MNLLHPFFSRFTPSYPGAEAPHAQNHWRRPVLPWLPHSPGLGPYLEGFSRLHRESRVWRAWGIFPCVILPHRFSKIIDLAGFPTPLPAHPFILFTIISGS